MITRLEQAMNRAWAKFKGKPEYVDGLNHDQKLKSGVLFVAHSEGFLAGAEWYRRQIGEE